MHFPSWYVVWTLVWYCPDCPDHSSQVPFDFVQIKSPWKFRSYLKMHSTILQTFWRAHRNFLQNSLCNELSIMSKEQDEICAQVGVKSSWWQTKLHCFSQFHWQTKFVEFRSTIIIFSNVLALCNGHSVIVIVQITVIEIYTICTVAIVPIIQLSRSSWRSFMWSFQVSGSRWLGQLEWSRQCMEIRLYSNKTKQKACNNITGCPIML